MATSHVMARVWTADKPYFDWEPIDSVSHRRLKEALLRPLLPALPGSQRDGLKDNDTADDLDDDDEDDFHRPDPLRVVDVANVCSECGVVASVHCRQCKDNRTEVSGGANETRREVVSAGPADIRVGRHTICCVCLFATGSQWSGESCGFVSQCGRDHPRVLMDGGQHGGSTKVKLKSIYEYTSTPYSSIDHGRPLILIVCWCLETVW